MQKLVRSWGLVPRINICSTLPCLAIMKPLCLIAHIDGVGCFQAGEHQGLTAKLSQVTSDRGTLTVGNEVVITRMRPANELVV